MTAVLDGAAKAKFPNLDEAEILMGVTLRKFLNLINQARILLQREYKENKAYFTELWRH